MQKPCDYCNSYECSSCKCANCIEIQCNVADPAKCAYAFRRTKQNRNTLRQSCNITNPEKDYVAQNVYKDTEQLILDLTAIPLPIQEHTFNFDPYLGLHNIKRKEGAF